MGDEPTDRVERDGVPLSVYEQPEWVTVGTGSYGPYHGLTVTLNLGYVGELVPKHIEDDLQAAFDEAYERTLARIDRATVDVDVDVDVSDETVVPVPREAAERAVEELQALANISRKDGSERSQERATELAATAAAIRDGLRDESAEVEVEVDDA